MLCLLSRGELPCHLAWRPFMMTLFIHKLRGSIFPYSNQHYLIIIHPLCIHKYLVYVDSLSIGHHHYQLCQFTCHFIFGPISYSWTCLDMTAVWRKLQQSCPWVPGEFSWIISSSTFLLLLKNRPQKLKLWCLCFSGHLLVSCSCT